MYRFVRTWIRKVFGMKKKFFVHLIAFEENFDLEKYLQDLRGQYAFKVVKGAGTHAQSIEIKIKPVVLRELIQNIPGKVAVSYEIQERPENC